MTISLIFWHVAVFLVELGIAALALLDVIT